MLAGNAKSFKSFQNSSHIIYSRLIRDSVKAVKTVMRPSAGACTKWMQIHWEQIMTNAYNLANVRITGVWQRTCILLVCNFRGVHWTLSRYSGHKKKKIKDNNESTKRSKREEFNGWAGHSLNYDDKERNTALFTYLHRLYESPGYETERYWKSKGNKV